VIPVLYRGSVKDLLGPVKMPTGSGVVFEYTDAYSVFDWGRMPDVLARKGEALATLTADWFEKLEQAESWKEFSRSPAALALRKGNRFGAVFNEIGEELQRSGLRTHYIGVVDQLSAEGEIAARPLFNSSTPVRRMVVKQVSVVKPAAGMVMGRALADYYPTRNATPPRLIPLEVVFRFSCPPGSSILDRVAKDPAYLASLGFPDAKAEPGVTWDFPVLEFFTKLEPTDRLVSLSEALALSGLSAEQLQQLLFKTAWVAAWLRAQCAKQGLELADGKLEWALDGQGSCILVDAMGPDELRILKGGVQLSKEFLRAFYRGTGWYEHVERAKSRMKSHGVSDWKRLVPEGPPALPAAQKELASQVYLALTNQLTGRRWFPDAWTLDRVVGELQALR